MQIKNLKKKWLRAKYSYWHNPFGYATFWDYWFKKYRGQNILTNAFEYDGKVKFLKLWFKIYKHRGTG